MRGKNLAYIAGAVLLAPSVAYFGSRFLFLEPGEGVNVEQSVRAINLGYGRANDYGDVGAMSAGLLGTVIGLTGFFFPRDEKELQRARIP